MHFGKSNKEISTYESEMNSYESELNSYEAENTLNNEK